MNLQQKHGWGACRQRMVKVAMVVTGVCLAGYIVVPQLFWHLTKAIVSVRRSSCPPCTCDCSSLPLLTLTEGLNNSIFTGPNVDPPPYDNRALYTDVVPVKESPTIKLVTGIMIGRIRVMVSTFLCLARYLLTRVEELILAMPDLLAQSANSFHAQRPHERGLFVILSRFGKSLHHQRDPEVSEEMEKKLREMLLQEMKSKEAETLENRQRVNKALLEAKKVTSQCQKEEEKCNSGMATCEAAREKAEAELREVTAMWELRARQKRWRGLKPHHFINWDRMEIGNMPSDVAVEL